MVFPWPVLIKLAICEWYCMEVFILNLLSLTEKMQEIGKVILRLQVKNGLRCTDFHETYGC